MASKMKSKNNKRKVETYESDGDDFISNDDGKAPKSKKTKTTSKATSSSKSSAEPSWDLGTKKRASVTNFKGSDYVSIREYYEKDGEQLPGKKGIMLNLAAYTALVKAIPAINKKLKENGHELDLGGDDREEVEEDEEEDEIVDDENSKAAAMRVKLVKKSRKANIEATSDEEEDDDD